MENLRKAYKKELDNLEIGENEEITAKILNKKFKSKALKQNHDEFKELMKNYHVLLNTFSKILNLDDETEKTDSMKFFEKHNVANEKSQIWTIIIENDKVEKWRDEI